MSLLKEHESLFKIICLAHDCMLRLVCLHNLDLISPWSLLVLCPRTTECFSAFCSFHSISIILWNMVSLAACGSCMCSWISTVRDHLSALSRGYSSSVYNTTFQLFLMVSNLNSYHAQWLLSSFHHQHLQHLPGLCFNRPRVILILNVCSIPEDSPGPSAGISRCPILSYRHLLRNL